ncbi:MAG: AAA family ATPase [Clostridia bacterium]|nr:AAA family ATPase [Clostridia bacterium]
MSTFEKIAGYKKEKEELAALVEIFNHREKYERKGATLPKGIIFYGPAGTGKTLFSEVLAQECSLKKITVSISDSASENNVCRNIKKAFLQAAKSKSPTMIFFDELDKVLPNESEEYYTDRSKAVLAQLLTLIDGMEKVNNVVFVATCNNYGDLPESITRAGRFDKKICLDLPDFAARVAILELYRRSSTADFEMSAESIARLTGGFSPAALKTLVNECILVSDENNYICEDIIRKKITEIKEEDIPSEKSEEAYRVDAVRNLGAFVIARAHNNSDYTLTVEENTVGNGFLEAVINRADYDYDEDEDEDDEEPYNEDGDASDKSPRSYSLCSKDDLLAAITALLGGLAAEELILHRTYDNLRHSLHSVDDILFKLSACGMLGLELYYNAYNNYRYSEKFIERFEEALLQIKTECYEKAKEQIRRNETLIKKLVPILIKRRSIEKRECEVLLAELGGIVSD